MPFIKRFAPFILAFALGLLVASFFVALRSPQIRFGRHYEYNNECRYSRMLREQREAEELTADDDAVENDKAIDFDSYEVKKPAAPTVPREVFKKHR